MPDAIARCSVQEALFALECYAEGEIGFRCEAYWIDGDSATVDGTCVQLLLSYNIVENVV